VVLAVTPRDLSPWGFHDDTNLHAFHPPQGKNFLGLSVCHKRKSSTAYTRFPPFSIQAAAVPFFCTINMRINEFLSRHARLTNSIN